jgi:RNA-binding protein
MHMSTVRRSPARPRPVASRMGASSRAGGTRNEAAGGGRADAEATSAAVPGAMRPKKKHGKIIRKTRPQAARKVQREASKLAAERAATPLSKGQLRFLKTLGHSLDPIVHLGKEGITDALVRGLVTQLATHELVKVRMLQEAPGDRKLLAPELATAAAAVLVQLIGRTALYFRPNPKAARIELPKV